MPRPLAATLLALALGASLGGCAARGQSDARGDTPRASCGPVCTLEVRNRLRVPIDVWAQSPSDPSTGGAPEYLGRVDALRSVSFRLRGGDARVRARAVSSTSRATGAADFAAECVEAGTTSDGTRTVLCG